MARVVVVSNRIDIPHQRQKKIVSGLTAAVHPCLAEYGGMWFGWNGQITEEYHSFLTQKVTYKGVDYVTVSLSKEDYQNFYVGYSNGALWPLLHYRPGLIVYHRSEFSGYLKVNQRFAQTLYPLLIHDDMIWVHDYHFIPLGAELRRLGSKHRIGFFLHTPIPPAAVMAILPDHAILIQALLAYDVIGFQTDKDLHHFKEYILEYADGQVDQDGMIYAYKSCALLKTFPISIDPKLWRRSALAGIKTKNAHRLQESLAEKRLIIGVDRLDYSKGLTERFEAYQILLQKWPQHKREVTFLQIAVLSRVDVRQYRTLKRQMEAMTGNINGQFAEFDWVPIRYINRAFSSKTLAAFYRIAHIGLVTPLRDGMNLVAKEFIASQSAEDPGVLILSTFAGASREFDGALIVNPLDRDNTAETMHEALIMSLEERQERWKIMIEGLQSNTINMWWNNFIDTLIHHQRKLS